MQIEGIDIRRVAVVDDDPSVREAMSDFLEDFDLEPVDVAGPLPDTVGEFAAQMERSADAVLCDYRLRKSDYAVYDGAEAVAACFGRTPFLLCTTRIHADADLIRTYRAKIPTIISPSQLNECTVEIGFGSCIREFRGDLSPERRPYKTLVRIVEGVDTDNAGFIYVAVPGWRPKELIRLAVDAFTLQQKGRLIPGYRFHAMANLGAESADELYINEFEFD